ncbi:MAG: methylmalonyl-CoA mutase, partial [Bacteroidota bacterium]
MSKSLFEDFEDVSSKAWKQKIQVDLKGADYNDTLIWNTHEGIDVKPFYHSDQLNEPPNLSDTKASHWKVGQVIEVTDIQTANETALDAINRGVEHIQFIIHPESTTIDQLVNDIDTSKISISVWCSFLSSEFVVNNKSEVHFETDIINHLARTGN